jgi:hypothetical protein
MPLGEPEQLVQHQLLLLLLLLQPRPSLLLYPVFYGVPHALCLCGLPVSSHASLYALLGLADELHVSLELDDVLHVSLELGDVLHTQPGAAGAGHAPSEVDDVVHIQSGVAGASHTPSEVVDVVHAQSGVAGASRALVREFRVLYSLAVRHFGSSPTQALAPALVGGGTEGQQTRGGHPLASRRNRGHGLIWSIVL